MDPDIIKYPLVNPNLIISVSPDSLRPKGLKVPVSLYVEGFEFNEDQIWINDKNPPKDKKNSKTPPDSFNLYTYQIYGPASADERITLGVPGKDGTKDNPKGVSGGNIQLYIEELAESDVNHLRINGSFIFRCLEVTQLTILSSRGTRLERHGDYRRSIARERRRWRRWRNCCCASRTCLWDGRPPLSRVA